MNGPITADDLHACADGHLDEGRAVEVERHLASYPTSRKRVEDYKTLNRALRAGLGVMLAEPVPPVQITLVLTAPRVWWTGVGC